MGRASHRRAQLDVRPHPALRPTRPAPRAGLTIDEAARVLGISAVLAHFVQHRGLALPPAEGAAQAPAFQAIRLGHFGELLSATAPPAGPAATTARRTGPTRAPSPSSTPPPARPA